MKHLSKAIITLSVCAFLLCGCGKEEETVVETIAPTPEPVQSTIEVQIEPEVTIEEHKGNTDIHIEQEETIPAEAYETETSNTEQTIEERLFDITTEDIRDMSTEDFKTYLHDVYKYQSAEFTEEDLAWIGEMSDADIAEAKQIMIDELNNAG